MPARRIALLSILAFSVSAGAEPRPALKGVSSIRIANYGAPSVLLESREQMRPLLDELNEVRRKDWRRGEIPVSCYSTVVLMSGKKRVGEFRVTAASIVERPVEKGQSSYSIALGPGEISHLAGRLAELLPAKCN